jgi:hypothetical protein
MLAEPLFGEQAGRCQARPEIGGAAVHRRRCSAMA